MRPKENRMKRTRSLEHIYRIRGEGEHPRSGGWDPGRTSHDARKKGYAFGAVFTESRGGYQRTRTKPPPPRPGKREKNVLLLDERKI